MISTQREESHLRILKIERHSVILEKISPEDAGLLETGGFIDHIKIKRDRRHVSTGMRAKSHARKPERDDSIRHAGRSDDPHFLGGNKRADRIKACDLV